METYAHFTKIYYYPYAVVYCVYTTVACAMTVMALGRLFKKGKVSCYNCCDCFTRFSSPMVKIAFGMSEGVSDDKEDKDDLTSRSNEKDLQSKKDNGGVYINKHKMDDFDVNILGIIILCFGFLVAISSIMTYVLNITYTCSEDSLIYCFPRFINMYDPQNPNITRSELMYPITDCNEWVRSSKITFLCFSYAYDLKAALATAGGLLVLFSVAMQVTISIILKVFKQLDKSCCGKCLLPLQISIALLQLPVNVGLVYVVIYYYVIRELGRLMNTHNPVVQVLISIADNGLEPLLLLGSAALLLLIPWSKYSKTEEKEQGDSTGQRRVSSRNERSEYIEIGEEGNSTGQRRASSRNEKGEYIEMGEEGNSTGQRRKEMEDLVHVV